MAGLGQEEATDGHLEKVLECFAFTLSVSTVLFHSTSLTCRRYYPGSDQRHKAYLERYPQAEALISPKGEGETIPWTM